MARLLLLGLALIHVSVAQEPVLEVMPDNILKKLGDDVYVQCAAKVENPDLVTEITWSGPDGRQIPNQEGTIYVEGYPGQGSLDLFIRKLREEDTGLYECSAVYAGNQKLTKSVEVESYMDIDFGDTATHQSAIINEDYKVRCNPQAKPAPNVDWLKDGAPVKNDEKHVIQQDGVLVKAVTEADEGVYRCRAKVIEIGSIAFRDIQLEVQIPPQIDTVPTDAEGVEKEAVTFECGASGKPAPTYAWVDKDNNPLEDREGYFVDQEKGTLRIMDLRPDHTGTYRCTASNPAGADTAEAHLQVLTKPKIEQYLNVTNAVDSDLELRCVTSGDPLPEVLFRKETADAPFQNGINADDRIEVRQEEDDQGRRVGILKIRGVARTDDGLYACTAQSKGGVTEHWGHITVEFKPTFEEQVQNEFWSWQQRVVNLTCLATSIPNSTIQWYFRNEEIPATDPNLKVLELGPRGVLQVNPVTNTYYGDYTCQATNVLGTAEYDIKFSEAHRPGPVASVTLEKKSATTIAWSIQAPMDNGGLPVQGYLVEYRLEDQPWDENTQSKFWVKQDSSYWIDSLEPSRTYVFRFAARNEAGDGEFSGEKIEQMPHISVPEAPIIFDVSEGVTEIPYSNEFTVRWSIPIDNGEPIDFYQIVYYKAENKTGEWVSAGHKTTETVQYPATVFKISDLRSSTLYKVELRAHNAIGFSLPTEAIIKTAHGVDPPEAVTSAPGVGLIVGLVVVAVLVLAVVVDVSCYCTNNAGITATVLGKRGEKEKDKEAMLEDGKNARPQTNRRTETNLGLRENSNNPFVMDQEMMNRPTVINQRTRFTHVTNQATGRPHSMAIALENPIFNSENIIKASNSTPILDQHSSTDSLYAVPHPEPVTRPNPQPRNKPPLPSRNPTTQLTQATKFPSQDHLNNRQQNIGQGAMQYNSSHPHHHNYDGNSRPMAAPIYDQMYDRSVRHQTYGSREMLGHAMPHRTMGGSQELLNYPRMMNGSHYPAPPQYPVASSHEMLYQSGVHSAPSSNYQPAPKWDVLNQPMNYVPVQPQVNMNARVPSVSSLNTTYYQPASDPHYDMKPRTAYEVARPGSSVSGASGRSAEMSHFPQNTGVVGKVVQHYPQPQQARPLPGPPQRPAPSLPPTVPPTMTAAHPTMPYAMTTAHPTMPSAVPTPPVLTSSRPAPPRRPPPVAPPVPPSSRPAATVTTVYLRDRPPASSQSHSMDHLDMSPTGPDSFSPTPPSLSSARSLGSLLSTDSSQRSYSQPTVI